MTFRSKREKPYRVWEYKTGGSSVATLCVHVPSLFITLRPNWLESSLQRDEITGNMTKGMIPGATEYSVYVGHYKVLTIQNEKEIS